jgi:phosphotransacetylase
MEALAHAESAFAQLACVAAARERLRQQPRPLRLLLWEAADARAWVAADRLRAVAGLSIVVLAHPAVAHEAAIRTDRTHVERLDANCIVEKWRRERSSSELVPSSPSEIAAAALALHSVDVVVGGLATTSAEVLRAGLRFVGLSKDVRTVSIGGFVEPIAGPAAGRLFLMTDTGAVAYPTMEQFTDIALNAVKSWRAVSREPPRVAFLSASTQGSASVLTSLAAIRGAIDTLRSIDPTLHVDGEMQADAAIVPSVAGAKGLSGAVAGRANILVFPSLDSCNIGYKLVEHLGGARTAPVTQGFARSYHDVSRGAAIEDFVATCIIAAVMALSGEEHRGSVG